MPNRRPISAAYLERKLRSIVGVAGENPLPDLADVNGLVVLESDRPEWAKPGGEVLAAAALSLGAVVGQAIGWELRNPLDSGVVVIIESAIVSSSLNNIVRAWLSLGVGDLPTDRNGAKLQRDLRGVSSVADSVAALFTSEQAAAPAVGGRQFSIQRCGVDSPVELLRFPVILAEGTQFFIDEVTANSSCALSLMWRERPLEGLFELK